MRALIPVFLALILVGCATPRERIVYKEVKIPVGHKCLGEIPPQQTYAGGEVSLDADIFDLVVALLIERDQRQTAELNLRSAIAGCQ